MGGHKRNLEIKPTLATPTRDFTVDEDDETEQEEEAD